MRSLSSSLQFSDALNDDFVQLKCCQWYSSAVSFLFGMKVMTHFIIIEKEPEKKKDHDDDDDDDADEESKRRWKKKAKKGRNSSLLLILNKPRFFLMFYVLNNTLNIPYSRVQRTMRWLKDPLYICFAIACFALHCFASLCLACIGSLSVYRMFSSLIRSSTLHSSLPIVHIDSGPRCVCCSYTVCVE